MKRPFPLLSMSLHCLFRLSVFCAVVICCSASAGDSPEEPDVSFSLREWRTQMLDEETPPSENRKFLLEMYVREGSPWKVVYCEEEKKGLTLRDSEGSCCSGMEYSYVGSDTYFPGVFSISTESWLPSPGAGWVEIQGSLSLVLSQESVETESIKLKTDKRDSVPLVLKAAAPGGRR